MPFTIMKKNLFFGGFVSGAAAVRCGAAEIECNSDGFRYQRTALHRHGNAVARAIHQGRMEEDNYGRDHRPRCFSMWMAGGGAIYGATYDSSYNIIKDAQHIRDFHATVLYLPSFHADRFSHTFEGLDAKLIGVKPAKPVKALLS